MTKYFVMFLIVISGTSCQKIPCSHVDHSPVSQRLTPSYDSLHDQAPIADTMLIITVKKISLCYMDSIEKIFHDQFQRIPYIKFGLPVNFDSSAYLRYEGAYWTRDSTMYVKNAFDHLLAVQFGTVQKNNMTRQRAHNFERVLVHELGHFYHDVVMQRLTDNVLGYTNCRSVYDSIASKVVMEGIADWIEMTYHKRCVQYIAAKFFPNTLPTRDQELWRNYGLSLVGPVFDCNPRLGIEYFVLHPFTIDINFSQSAKRYQSEAIMFINNHQQ